MKHIPNINYTTKNDICTGCGVCEGACPSNAIQMQVIKGNFRPAVNENLCKNEKGCHRCFDSCPGVGVNLTELARLNFSETEIKKDLFVGSYIKCYTGYSNDYEIRYHSASGGMVSQFLIWLLEHDKIDGVVVTAYDKQAPLMVRSYIATTREEILQAKSSKYAPVTLNHAIQDIKKAKGDRYVIVGVPCHIEGFRKYEQMDKRFKEKIIGYFALYCSSGRSFYLTEHVFKERNIDASKLTYFAYRDNGCLGNMVAKGDGIFHEERFQDYYQPLRSFFVPRRCSMCIDHYGELGDVSFGDIHIDPYIDDKIGINSLVVRNKTFMDWLNEAKQDGTISLDEISVDILNKSQVMAPIKKYRNSAFVRFNKAIGKKVPNYDVLPKGGNTLKFSISFIHTNLQQTIGRHKSLWFFIDILKGKGAKR